MGGDKIEADFHGLVIGPKTPCRIRYRRRANPSITIAKGEDLRKVATQNPAVAAAAAGCPVDHQAMAATPVAAPGVAKCPVDHAALAKEPAPVAPPTAIKPATLRIRLDLDLCQGHAMCVGEAPEVFAIGENGKVKALNYSPPPELHDKVRAAAQFCPTRAIRLKESQ